MALPLFAATLFVSAFILFLVQPMIGKLILPKLGGTPQVWNTCSMFFQTALLAGYAYTHTLSTRLTLRGQLMVHSALLVVPFIVLFAMGRPFNVDGFEAPPGGANPVLHTLLFLTLIVGLPFFVVSTSAPLLQKWFAGTGHPAAKDPYFLYGASNLGSLLALLAYPFVVEPFFALDTQAWVWAVGYLILVGTVLACVSMVWQSPSAMALADTGSYAEPPPPEIPVPSVADTSTAVKPESAVGRSQFRKRGRTLPESKTLAAAPTASARPDVVDWPRRLRWIFLSLVPSSLMLGVITFVSTDLSPFPLLWVAPLALYLLSFVLVYLRYPTVWVDSPHTAIKFCFPLFVLGLAYISLGGAFHPFATTIMAFLGFFGVALFCHGELARDRPATRYLTEYYLCMSFGGMLGGVFNGLFAPILFWGIAEFPIILVIACLLKQASPEGGWLDDLLFSSTPGKATLQQNKDALSYALDVGLALILLGLCFGLKAKLTISAVYRFWIAMGSTEATANSWTRPAHNIVVYGIPIVICFFLANRPLRLGLALAAFLFVNLFLLDRAERGTTTLFSGRSYFGVLRVFENEVQLNVGGKEVDGKFTSMLHGTTLHGENYFEPPSLKRLATTYYHRLGPVGVVMERYNWFYGDQVTADSFHADLRMPSALVGLGASSIGGLGNLPLDMLVHTWSEPPYATVGLGTGTMASYARPFQHMTYYEIDQTVRNFSLPPDDRFLRDGKYPFFSYLQGALARGVNLEVIMGDARQTMEKELRQPANELSYNGKTYGNIGQPDATHSPRNKYYKVMVIDAFSSDAIPVHLLTYESVKLYSEKLADDGVLCIHTSNRHLDLVKPVVDIATKLKLKFRYGNDRRDGGTLGHTGSNYVMLARDEKYLNFSTDPKSKVFSTSQVDWKEPSPSGSGRYLWTDNYSNIVSVIR